MKHTYKKNDRVLFKLIGFIYPAKVISIQNSHVTIQLLTQHTFSNYGSQHLTLQIELYSPDLCKVNLLESIW